MTFQYRLFFALIKQSKPIATAQEAMKALTTKWVVVKTELTSIQPDTTYLAEERRGEGKMWKRWVQTFFGAFFGSEQKPALKCANKIAKLQVTVHSEDLKPEST